MPTKRTTYWSFKDVEKIKEPFHKMAAAMLESEMVHIVQKKNLIDTGKMLQSIDSEGDREHGIAGANTDYAFHVEFRADKNQSFVREAADNESKDIARLAAELLKREMPRI